MPGWIGPWEIAIVLVLVLLILGPRKLPELGRSLGRSITGFKQGLQETREEVQAAIRADETATPDTETKPVATTG
jgi:sec-independent protein translocase protein TatA